MAVDDSSRTARMSRPQRRAQLLDAARAVFVAQGFHAAAMDGIADAAGVSKPVLYQHFPSKLALYQALLDVSAAEMVRLIRDAIASSEDNSVRIHRAVAAYFDFVADENQAFRFIFESDLRAEPEAAAVVDKAIESTIRAISDTITADTGTDVSAARLLAAGLVGLSQVSARYWLTQREPIPQDRAVDLLSTLAWRGISHFPLHGDEGTASPAAEKG